MRGRSRAESRFAARSETGLTPLIGRQPELSMLLDRFEQAKDGEGQVVLLSGEPGIGKSSPSHQGWTVCPGSACRPFAEPVRPQRAHCVIGHNRIPRIACAPRFEEQRWSPFAFERTAGRIG